MSWWFLVFLGGSWGVLVGLGGSWWVLVGLCRSLQICANLGWPQQVLVGLSGFYWVSVSPTGFQCLLVHLGGSHWVLVSQRDSAGRGSSWVSSNLGLHMSQWSDMEKVYFVSKPISNIR